MAITKTYDLLNINGVKGWIRDSWARRAIAALQQRVAGIVVPTKTSELTNDSGYITSADVPPGSTASSTTPLMNGTAAVGTENAFARGDHRHPTDTSRQAALSTTQMAAVNSGVTAAKVQAWDGITVPTKTSDLTNDSDFQTGTQVGNAISAEAGLMIPYGYCTTAAGTVAKTVTVSPTVTELTTGLIIAVKFQYTNTGANPTLNVNELGAKAIKRYGTTAAGTSAAANWNANSVVILVYDGTYWQLADWNNTTYSGMSDAEYQAGTGTNNRLITPARLKAAILLHAPVQSVNGATGDVTVNVPTKTSELANDSGFLTSAPVTSVNGQTGAVSLDATDVGALPDTTVIPTVPTNVSAFNNDAGYMTSAPVTSVNNKTGAVNLTASDVGALPSSTVIPSASSTAPAMDGTASAGSSTAWARGDHVHPHDTSKQDALSTAQLAAVNSGITAETLYPTTISSLTPYSGRCTISDGGYIKIGKIVFLSATIESNQQSGTTSSYIFTDVNADLVPMSGRAVLSVLNETAKNTVTKAAVDESGRIVVTNCATAQTLRFSGCYISA